MNISHNLLFDIIANKSNFKYVDQLIHLFTGGSQQHGARLPGKGDLDICGIYLESLTQLTAMRGEKGFVGGTGNDESRNTSDDEDYTFKTLREWAVLAGKGNPTMLGYLSTNDSINDPIFKDSIWFSEIVPNAHLFASKQAGTAFLRYGLSQFQRMQGLRGTGKHGQRDELTIKFGYDLKAAMHMIRMMYEGIEFMQTGAITNPRPEKEMLIDIREGKLSKTDVTNSYYELENSLKLAITNSYLPEKVDNEKINDLLLRAHQKGWKYAIA